MVGTMRREGVPHASADRDRVRPGDWRVGARDRPPAGGAQARPARSAGQLVPFVDVVDAGHRAARGEPDRRRCLAPDRRRDGAERATFDLPAAGWAAYETETRFQYVFKNRTAPLGLSKVKVAALKRQGTLKVAAKSSGLTLDEASQGAVSIVLRIGDDMYCSRCETPTADGVGRYRARTCPAPASCGGICGDGVVGASESCDGADLGTCDDNAVFHSPGCEAPGDADQCSCCTHDICVYPGNSAAAPRSASSATSSVPSGRSACRSVSAFRRAARRTPTATATAASTARAAVTSALRAVWPAAARTAARRARSSSTSPGVSAAARPAPDARTILSAAACRARTARVTDRRLRPRGRVDESAAGAPPP